MSITIEKGLFSKTRKSIIEALLQLMETDDFQQITIMQIAQEAGIARKTFYLNYTSKIDVLTDYINVLYQDFKHKQLLLGKPTPREFLIALFSFWKTHQEALQLLEQSHMFSLMQEEFEHIMSNDVFFDANSIIGYVATPTQARYVTVVVATSLWRMLKEWVKNGMQDRVEDIVDLFMQMFSSEEHHAKP